MKQCDMCGKEELERYKEREGMVLCESCYEILVLEDMINYGI